MRQVSKCSSRPDASDDMRHDSNQYVTLTWGDLRSKLPNKLYFYFKVLKVGHVSHVLMRLDERNILAPTPCFYLNPIKSYMQKRIQS